MDISDILFNGQVSVYLKQAIIQLMDNENITDPNTKVLHPTATNDDVNGSQHARNGGTDFTYRDATDDDVSEASSLGYYEYFSVSGRDDEYTGHYYEGSDRKFDAIVLDPPQYAATVYV